MTGKNLTIIPAGVGVRRKAPDRVLLLGLETSFHEKLQWLRNPRIWPPDFKHRVGKKVCRWIASAPHPGSQARPPTTQKGNLKRRKTSQLPPFGV